MQHVGPLCTAVIKGRASEHSLFRQDQSFLGKGFEGLPAVQRCSEKARMA